LIGSPRSRMAALRQAAISRAPRSRSSGMLTSVGEQKANSQLPPRIRAHAAITRLTKRCICS
jgi:hypothetical protein